LRCRRNSTTPGRIETMMMPRMTREKFSLTNLSVPK